MLKVNIHDAKTNLSKYVHMVEQGEVIQLCRRNEPVAEIKQVSSQPKPKRKLGLAREKYGEYELPDSFWDPLPPEIMKYFEGGGDEITP